MDRRTFIASAGAMAATAAAATTKASARPHARADEKFSMHFAPHFGMFRHHAGDDLVAQLEFAADRGFTGWEDNGMAGRSAEDQERIAAAMSRLNITMGVFVLNMGTAWGPHFSRNRDDDRERFLDEARKAVDVAKRVNAKWMTVVPGTRELRIPLEYQTAYAVESLKRACEILEPHGLIMVLEPLNPRDHPNMLLAEMGHAYQICKAINSPSCKILCDLYHQQATEGNLIENFERSWDEVAYFQIGDNPGRREPNTGEVHYANIFARIKARGFDGILGMEHGNSRPGREGEQAVIDAYRACDPR
ncbi:MAG: TIM barrel protein [Phycisphaerales bacterium]|nr:TIM barrel protein [Planctomycetota bacterium]MCH8508696.1 TIM barrel protein [Phycisphaerales bacterium]